CGGAANVSDDGGMNENAAIDRAGAIEVDTAEAAIEPLFRVAQHEMILRQIRIGVPGFRQRGGAAGKLRAVARRIGTGKHIEQYVGTIVVSERADDVMKADIAGSDVVLVAANVRNEIVEDRFSAIGGNEADDERHGVRGLTAGVIPIGLRMEEMGVEGAFDFARFDRIGGSFIWMIEQRGDARHSGEVLIVDGSRSDTGARELRFAGGPRADIKPVAQAIDKQVAL